MHCGPERGALIWPEGTGRWALVSDPEPPSAPADPDARWRNYERLSRLGAAEESAPPRAGFGRNHVRGAGRGVQRQSGSPLRPCPRGAFGFSHAVASRLSPEALQPAGGGARS